MQPGQIGVSQPRAYDLRRAVEGQSSTPHDHPRVYAGANLLPNREVSYPRIIDAIDGAVQHVGVGQYILLADGAGAQVLQALRRAADRGVRVQVIADREGSMLFHRKLANAQAFDRILGGHPNVDVLRFAKRLNPLRGPIYHTKLVSIDGVNGTAFTGSGSFDGKPWGEHWVEFRGAAAGQLLAEHTASWVSAGGTVSDVQRHMLDQAQAAGYHQGAVGSRLVYNRPGVDLAASRDTLSAMRNAQRRIWVQSPFLGSSQVIDELTQAARSVADGGRGIDVRVISSGAGHTGSLPLVAMLGQSYYRELLDAGVQVYEQQRGFGHYKNFLTDDEIRAGSMNATSRSLLHDEELMLSSNERHLVQQFEAKFTSDQADARRILPSDLNTRRLRLLNSAAGRVVRTVLNWIE